MTSSPPVTWPDRSRGLANIPAVAGCGRRPWRLPHVPRETTVERPAAGPRAARAAEVAAGSPRRKGAAHHPWRLVPIAHEVWAARHDCPAPWGMVSPVALF